MQRKKVGCAIIDDKVVSNKYFDVQNQSIIRNSCDDGFSRTVCGINIISAGIQSWNIKVNKCKCWCNNKSIGIIETANMLNQYTYYLSGNITISGMLFKYHPLKTNDIVTMVIDSNKFELLIFVNMIKIASTSLPFDRIDNRIKCGGCGGDGRLIY